MATPKFHELEVVGVRRLTNEAIAIRFNVPQHLKPEYEFVPGQYLTLRAQIEGEDTRRSYSISSAVGDPLEVGIKQVESGRFSGFAATLQPGDRLQVMTPQGNFKADIRPGHTDRNSYLLIAAGSGITPCLSILKSTLSEQPDSTCVLLYGNRDMGSVMFNDDVNALKDKYTSRFMLIHLLSRERQDAELLNGRIDAQKLRRLADAGLIDVSRYDGIYLCGPQAMIDQCRGALSDMGVADSMIHFELFTTANQQYSAQHVQQKTDEPVNTETTSVKIILDGARRDVEVDAASETVLMAAKRAGLDLPFSCAGGMCCTCRCKVVSGNTAMDMNFSLADWEVDDGFTLACQTRPLSADVVLDFDAS